MLERHTQLSFTDRWGIPRLSSGPIGLFNEVHIMDDWKACFKCFDVKPLSEFYKHPRMADGHLGKCKECARADVAGNYAKRREQYAEYERERFQRPERKRQVVKYQRNRRALHPEKNRAYGMVRYAIRDGSLLPQPCIICGDEDAQAHHDDYSKPLDVTWLCRKHHLAVHGKVAYEAVIASPT